MSGQTPVIFCPKKGTSADWVFYPSAKRRKWRPGVPCDQHSMGLQRQEVFLLLSLKIKDLKKTRVVIIDGGRVELLNYDADWETAKLIPKDTIVWDEERLFKDWSRWGE